MNFRKKITNHIISFVNLILTNIYIYNIFAKEKKNFYFILIINSID